MICVYGVLVTMCPPAGPIQSHSPSWPLARCGRRRGAILRCARDSGTSRMDTLPQLVTPPLDNGTSLSFLVLQLHISPSMPFWESYNYWWDWWDHKYQLPLSAQRHSESMPMVSYKNLPMFLLKFKWHKLALLGVKLSFICLKFAWKNKIKETLRWPIVTYMWPIVTLK